MIPYRLLYGDMKTGIILGELPATSVEAEHILNAPGSLRASMPLTSAPALVLSPQRRAPELNAQDVATARTVLYLERGGLIVWAGPMWTRRVNVADDVLEVGAEGWMSYWRRRTIRVQKVYAAVDQALIVKDLFDWAESMSGGNVGLDTSGITPHGVLRDRTYEAYERKVIAEAVEQLGAVDGGFDYIFTNVWSGQAVLTRLVLQYPATGRATDLVLEVGTNIDVLEWTSDGTEVANLVDAVGGGEGIDQLIRMAIDMDSLYGEYPRLETILAFTDVTVPATLTAHAVRGLTRARVPIDTMRCTLGPDVVPVFGSYLVGDLVRLRGYQGGMELDQTMRITQVALEADDTSDSVTVDLTNVEVFR